MAKIVYLFAFVALVQTASALQCYTCERGSDPTCNDIAKLKKIPECGKTADKSHAGACLKEVYTDSNGKEVTERRCVIADKSADNKLTFNCNKPDIKVSVCEFCTDDLCNSAPTISFSFATFLGVVAAYLIPRYM